MEDYKPNSRRSKEENKNNVPAKKVEKVVTGTVRTKKKSGFSKLRDTFVSDDVQNVKSYVLTDILVPSAKKLVSEIVDTILFGESRGGGRRRSSSEYISYNKYSDKRDDRRYSESRSRVTLDFDDIVFDNMREAEEVLERMDELLVNYGVVSVADFYDLAGITGDYTYNKYGWTNLRSAVPVRLRDGGYIIKLPRATLID